jgi:hypothetical protein
MKTQMSNFAAVWIWINESLELTPFPPQPRAFERKGSPVGATFSVHPRFYSLANNTRVNLFPGNTEKVALKWLQGPFPSFKNR